MFYTRTTFIQISLTNTRILCVVFVNQKRGYNEHGQIFEFVG